MSTVLMDFTWDLHKEAERSDFAKRILRGEASKEEYTRYLYNLLAIYDPIEFSARRQGFFDNMPGIERLRAIYEDFLELDTGEQYQLVPSVIEYHDYLVKLANDPLRRHLIKAHVYVRHTGDLNGGQVLKRRVAHMSAGKMYDFEDAEMLKENIKTMVTEDLGPEARLGFIYAIRMMRELGGE